MTAADERFWTLLHRRMNGLQTNVADALLRSLGIVRDSLSEDELARIITAGALARILLDVLSDVVLNRAFAPYRRALQTAVERGFELTRTADLPRSGKVGNVVAVHFDPMAPATVDAIRALDQRFTETAKQELRDAVTRHVNLGLETGLTPRAIARATPSVIGLGPQQVEQVDHFRAALSGDAERSVTDYALRDPRVDAMLENGPLTTTQIEKYTELYRRERVAGNVATASQTATRQSYKTGQATAWREAVNTGFVGGRLMKQWLQIERPTKRLTHAKMNGQIVPFDSPYSNGQMIPGEDPEDYNCACVSRVFAAGTREP
jgi:hypothetical protein